MRIALLSQTQKNKVKNGLHNYATNKIDCYQSFIYSPTDAPVSCLKNGIKIYIKTAPTCFGVTVTP
jgi:hypothetical protein